MLSSICFKEQKLLRKQLKKERNRRNKGNNKILCEDSSPDEFEIAREVK
jgi:hypothetical protein